MQTSPEPVAAEEPIPSSVLEHPSSEPEIQKAEPEAVPVVEEPAPEPIPKEPAPEPELIPAAVLFPEQMSFHNEV